MNRIVALVFSIALILAVSSGFAISIYPDSIRFEDFTISATQTAVLPAGWKADNPAQVRTLGNYATALESTTQYAGNGMSGSATNGIYNYGAGVFNLATDRSVGSLSSGSATKSGNLYVLLTNTGTAEITSFTLSYEVEKYRSGTNAAGFSFQMYYSTDGAVWTSAGPEFLTSFAADAATAGYASAPGDSAVVSNRTLTVTVPIGGNIYLAWNYSVSSGAVTTSSQGLGIDDVSITAHGSGGGSLATVTTDAITAITTTTATGGGNVTADGGSTVIARGICWSTSANPVITGNHTTDGTGTGSFVSSMTGLSASTTYYVRAYATNVTGTAYGNEVPFNTAGIAPPAPVATAATSITSNIFTANWNASTGATSYRLDVSTGSGFSTFVSGYNNLLVTGTSQSVTGLAFSTPYFYRVRAVNTGGTSLSSNTITVVTIASDPFNGYYNSVEGLSGAALKTGLNTILKTGITQFSYNDVTTQLQYTDEDSLNTTNVIEIYTGWSVPKANYGGGTTDWNKEHTWSKSHGGFGDVAPAGTDLHHLRPCDSTVNSAKNNADFDEATDAYVDGSPPAGYTGDTGCYKIGNTVWEPRPADKGDVARMIFYMTVRYEGTTGSGGVDPYDLEPVDYLPSSPNGEPYYAKLSTLLAWNSADPPDSWERRRNNRIYERQGNRNPFIDHPEYITLIWGGGPQAPTVTTAIITSIALTTATGGGEVINAGTAPVTARGICWSSAGTPSIVDNHTTDGSGTGVFSSSLTTLLPSTMYYVRAYATSTVGTAYGNEVTFTTLKAEPTAHVTTFTAGTPTTLSIPLSWTDALADGYLIKGSAVSYADIVAPIDGLPESDALLVKNISQGSQTCSFTGLNSNTAYYFKIYPYNNSGTGINYKTDGTVPQATATTLNTIVLTVSPATLSFIVALNEYSAPQMLTVTSSGLTQGITVTSPGPYYFCTLENGTYEATLSLPANYNGAVWAKTRGNMTSVQSNPMYFDSGPTRFTVTATTTTYDPNASTASDLFISEYIEGSSFNKGIEIFNGTGVTVNLSSYRIANYFNGGTTANLLPLGNIDLLNGECYTVVHSSASAPLQALADLLTTSGAVNFNGDDAVVLEKTTDGLNWSYVDIFGRIGDDPGTEWTGAGGYSTLNKTLVRKPTVAAGITVSPTGTGVTAFTTLTNEWDLFPVDTFNNFGTHTFQPPVTITAPQNVTAVVSGADIILSWDAVPTATSYNIYMADNPYGLFGSVAATINTNITLFGYAAANYRAFFQVRANR